MPHLFSLAVRTLIVGGFASLALIFGWREFGGSVAPESNFKYLAQISQEGSAFTSQATTSSEAASAPTKSSSSKTRKKMPSTPVTPDSVAQQHSNILQNVGMSGVPSSGTVQSSTPVPAPSVSPAAPPVSAAKECHFQTNQFPNYRNVILNEVAWMGTTESANYEWIELKNVSNDAADISGWQLVDRGEQIGPIIPAGTKINRGGFYILERNENALPAIKAGVVYTGALSNENEGLRLFDAECHLVDEVLANPKWPGGDNDEKRSMERWSDYSWHTYSGRGTVQTGSTYVFYSTPELENSPPPAAPAAPQTNLPTGQAGADATQTNAETNNTNTQSNTSIASSTTPPPTPPPTPEPTPPPSGINHLLISEIMAGSDASADYEFIELYNPTSQAIDLTGWTIKKKSSTGSESLLVATSRLTGKSIAAGKYFLLGHDTKYSGSVAADVAWPASYSLAYTNNSVVVYDGTSANVDEVSWIEILKNQSMSRKQWQDTDSASDFEISVTPTPQNSGM